MHLIRDILPHVSALNQLYCSKDKLAEDAKEFHLQNNKNFLKDNDDAKQFIVDLCTTSNHYTIVESQHPYKSSSITNIRFAHLVIINYCLLLFYF